MCVLSSEIHYSVGQILCGSVPFLSSPPPPPILSIDVSYSRVIYAVTRFQRGNKKAPTGRKEPGALRCGIFLSSEIGRGGGGGKMGPNAGGMMWAKKNRSKQL